MINNTRSFIFFLINKNTRCYFFFLINLNCLVYLYNSNNFSFVKGGGIETDYYTHWRRTMHNIEKMTHLSDTVSRLYEACADHKSQNWLINLNGSGWMRYIESTMTAAYKTALFISKDSKYIFFFF